MDSIWAERRVLVTGHTGFKGAWLSLWLAKASAAVTGLSIDVPTDPSLFGATALADVLADDLRGDVRDLDTTRDALASSQAEVVFHLAAQPLVRRSYAAPVDTFSTNVMGTVNLLEAARLSDHVRAVVVVTSDKCYANREWPWAYREYEAKGGDDPYSASKGCAELVVDAYRRSFFREPAGPRVASARAGNVIGGGDWAEDRLFPDIAKALSGDRAPVVRNPEAVRPWQHVLCPVAGYVRLAEALLEGRDADDGWNFGPSDADMRSVREVADAAVAAWPGGRDWTGPAEGASEAAPRETLTLRVDSAKARTELGWRPAWDLGEAIARSAAWYRAFAGGQEMRTFTEDQISAYQDDERL